MIRKQEEIRQLCEHPNLREKEFKGGRNYVANAKESKNRIEKGLLAVVIENSLVILEPDLWGFREKKGAQE